jgi:hypothetical protein
MTNRRQFLWTCSALTLSASLAPAAGWAGAVRVREVTLDQLSFAAFFTQVGTRFRLAQGAGAANLKLVAAKALPDHGPADAQNETFSLLFAGPKQPALAQDTHCFEHPELGVFEMFIVPVGPPDSSLVYYEAVFNRPVRTTLTKSLT